MTIKMNEALIKEINKAKVKNHSIIEKATGIDKSTISLHLNSRRPISIEQARAYAKFLDIPLIKVIDDTVVKYRVVKYVNKEGTVSNPTEWDFDVILAPNEIKKEDQLCIYDKERNSVYWYDPKKSCHEHNVINRYCFIKSVDGEFLGYVKTYKGKDMTYFNVHMQKIIKTKTEICYPIVAITFLDFAKQTKVENSL